MTSLTRWTWVWVNSGSWWWTGRPGVLRFMGSQRVRHDSVTEQQHHHHNKMQNACSEVHIQLHELLHIYSPMWQPTTLIHRTFPVKKKAPAYFSQSMLPPATRYLSSWFLSPLVRFFLAVKICVSEDIHCISFCVWLLFSTLIHLAVHIHSMFFFMFGKIPLDKHSTIYLSVLGPWTLRVFPVFYYYE